MKTLGKSIRSPVIVVAGVIGTICLLSILFPGGVRLLEILTYNARVKVSASIPEPSHFSPKLGTVLIDDVAMEQVNDGSLALFYAAATDEESARKLYPRQWPWPRFIHGQIVRELTAEGALGTCFDLLFPGLSERRLEESVVSKEELEERAVQHFVRHVTNPAEVSSDGGKSWKRLHAGMKLQPNWLLRTGDRGTIDLLLNPDQSAIRVTENTTVGTGRGALLTRPSTAFFGDRGFESKGRLSSDEFFAEQMRKAGNVSVGVQSEDTVPADLFLTNRAGLSSIRLQVDVQGVVRRVKPFDEIREWHPLIREIVKPLDLKTSRARIEGRQLIVPRGKSVAQQSTHEETLIVPLNANGSLKLTHEGQIDFADDSQDQGPENEFPYRVRRVWNMGFVMAAKALQLDLENPKISTDKIVLQGPKGVMREIPLDSDGYMNIDWSVRYRDLRGGKVYNASLAELLQKDKVRSEGRTIGIGPFNNRVVLVGVVATGENLTDRGATAAESNTPLLMTHLNVANSVLTERFIKQTSRGGDLALIIMTGLAAAGIGFSMRAVWASLAGVLLAALYVVTAVSLFVNYLYWVPIVMPVGCALVVTHVCILIERGDPMTAARRFFSRAGFGKIESLSPALLLLHPKEEGQPAGLAALWKKNAADTENDMSNALRVARKKGMEETKIYLIYQGEVPPSSTIQRWRQQLGCEIIPLLGAMLEKASGENEYERRLRQLEEPYLIRADPYAEFKPIADPTWFYGRHELLERLPALLAQGQHVAIFGLRKVGKTSLTNQLRERFVSTPSAFIDCQGLPAKAESYFDLIYRELHTAVKALGIKRMPKPERITDGEMFREKITELFGRWSNAGRREPFVLMFDEIDKFFPNPEIAGREEILAEYVRVFRAIRDLAQRCHCFVACVVAYRPTVNRQNILTPEIGENPMFNSFQEIYLGFLSAGDSEAMVREIGLWKNIIWEENAARRVFEFCGGHPLMTRYFASYACQKGHLKLISEGRVLNTAMELEKTLRKNEIGNYYREAIGNLLLPEEQRLLNLIREESEKGYAETDLSDAEQETLSNLENFGLVENLNGRLRVTARFFRVWLERRGG